jgi:mycothiol synthase
VSVDIRPVATRDDIHAFLAVRDVVDPEHPMTWESFEDSQKAPGRLDVLAWDDGRAVGCAFVERQWGDPVSPTGYLSIRVRAEERRRGVGTALLARVSDHVRGFGGTDLHAQFRGEAVDQQSFLEHHGFREVGRMQDVEVDLAAADGRVDVPAGIEIVPLNERHAPGMHAVALEADPDIPSATPIRTGDLERWYERHLGPLAIRDLSFVALAGDEIVGFAILGECVPGVGEHWMTGVKRAWRGRGVAVALKQAQIAAARAAGLERLRTQNDLANAPMRRVNEKLGYLPRLEWLQYAGPLLSTEGGSHAAAD